MAFGQDPLQQAMSQASGFAPISSGLAPQFNYGMPNLFGNSPFGMIAQMLIGPQLQQFTGQHGMFMSGIFGHDQNLYDTMRNQKFSRDYQRVISEAAQSDKPVHQQSIEGLMRLAGAPMGAQQRGIASGIADFIANNSSMMSQMFPDIMEQLGGQRGSSAVMSQRMMMADRYRIDPVTGLMGRSAESTSHLAKGVFEDLYVKGDISQMQGMTAGRLGGMYDELTRRGMISGGDRNAELREAARAAGIKIENPDGSLSTQGLQDLQSSDVGSSKLRNFDKKRVEDSLKRYTDVVTALRDLFGDNGRPDAPMSELINQLEQMSQGGMSRLSPGSLATMVRETRQLARQGGVSMDTVNVMQQHYAGKLEAFGADTIFAPQVTKENLAWGNAYRASGQGAITGWGRFNADQMTQMEGNLRAAATGSVQAQQLAVLMRAREMSGGFERGSEAEALTNALEQGETTFNGRSARLSSDEFERILGRATGLKGENLGLAPDAVRQMMSQRTTNEEYIHKYKLGGIVRQMQSDEAQLQVGREMSGSITARLQQMGLSRNEAIALGEQAGGSLSADMFAASGSVISDTDRRRSMMATSLQKSLGGNTALQAALAASGQSEETFFAGFGEQLYGQANQNLLDDPSRQGFGGFVNYHALMSKSSLAEGRRAQMQGEFDAAMEKAAAPFGRGTMVSRLVTALQGVDLEKPDDIKSVIAKTLGTNKMQVDGALRDEVLQFESTRQKVEKLQSDFIAIDRDPNSSLQQRQNARDELTKEQNNLGNLGKSVANLGNKAGLITDTTTLTAEDVSKAESAWQQADRISGRTQNMTGTEFWKSTEGTRYTKNVNTAMQHSRSMLDKAIGSPAGLQKLGLRGIEMQKQGSEAIRNLEELAKEYTGGDVSKLLAGDFDQKALDKAGQTSKNLTNTVTQWRTQLDTVTTSLGEASGRAGAQWYSDAEREDAMKATAKKGDTSTYAELRDIVTKVEADSKSDRTDAKYVAAKERIAEADKSLNRKSAMSLLGIKEDYDKLDDKKKQEVDEVTEQVRVLQTLAPGDTTKIQEYVKSQDVLTSSIDELQRNEGTRLKAGLTRNEVAAAASLDTYRSDVMNEMGLTDYKNLDKDRKKLVDTETEKRRTAGLGQLFGGTEASKEAVMNDFGVTAAEYSTDAKTKEKVDLEVKARTEARTKVMRAKGLKGEYDSLTDQQKADVNKRLSQQRARDISIATQDVRSAADAATGWRDEVHKLTEKTGVDLTTQEDPLKADRLMSKKAAKDVQLTSKDPAVVADQLIATMGLTQEKDGAKIDTIRRKLSSGDPTMIEEARSLAGREYRLQQLAGESTDGGDAVRKMVNEWDKTFGGKDEQGKPIDPTKAKKEFYEKYHMSKMGPEELKKAELDLNKARDANRGAESGGESAMGVLNKTAADTAKTVKLSDPVELKPGTELKVTGTVSLTGVMDLAARIGRWWTS